MRLLANRLQPLLIAATIAIGILLATPDSASSTSEEVVPRPTATRAQAGSFRYFLALAYPGVPADLPGQLGAEPLNCFNPTPFVWDDLPTNDTAPPSLDEAKQGLDRMLGAASASPVSWPFGDSKDFCLDWEHFWQLVGQASVDLFDPDLLRTRSNLSKFILTAQMFRKALDETGRSERRFGYYGVAPIDAWSPVLANPASTGFSRQSQAHHLPEMAELVESVDFLTTSAYLPPNPSAANWAHIENTLRLAGEIKRKKPLYVFVWPQYSSTHEYMDVESWRRQLDLARRYGDGMIVWGSATLPGSESHWNPDARWWLTFRDWLEQNR